MPVQIVRKYSKGNNFILCRNNLSRSLLHLPSTKLGENDWKALRQEVANLGYHLIDYPESWQKEELTDNFMFTIDDFLGALDEPTGYDENNRSIINRN